jgi:hypothetical protein
MITKKRILVLLVVIFSLFQSTIAMAAGVYRANLWLSSVNGTTVNFTWSSITDASSLVIQESLDNTNWNSVTTLPTTAINGSVTGLTPLTTYYFRLVVIGGTYDGNSNVLTINISEQPIVALATGSITQTTVGLTWPAAVGATSIIVQQSLNGTAWTNALAGTVGATDNSATVTGLSEGTAYKFRLIVNGGQNGGTSNVISATTGSIPITTMSVALGGTNSVKLMWPLATRATGVKIERLIGTTWTPVLTLPVTATTGTVSGLTPNTAYKFRVNVTGGMNNGPSNVVDFTTNGLAVTSFANTTKTDTKASFQWWALTGATLVGIEQLASGGTTWTPSTTSVALTAESRTAVVTGLVPNKAYQFRLVVTGGIYGTSAGTTNSNIISVTTNAQPIVALATGSITQTTVGITWPAAVGATGIIIQQSLNGTAWTNAVAGTVGATDNSATVTGLSQGTAYKFRVLVNGGQNSGTSNVVSATTGSIPITTLSVALGGTNSVKLVWPLATRATGVKIERLAADGTTWTPVLMLSATATTGTVSGLTPNTAYKFRVNVTGGMNEGTSNVVDVTTLASPIKSFSGISLTSTTITVSWPKAIGASFIEVQQFLNGIWVSAPAGSISINDTTAVVAGLMPNTYYKFRLNVVDGQNEGYSNEINVLTRP